MSLLFLLISCGAFMNAPYRCAYQIRSDSILFLKFTLQGSVHPFARGS